MVTDGSNFFKISYSIVFFNLKFIFASLKPPLILKGRYCKPHLVIPFLSLVDFLDPLLTGCRENTEGCRKKDVRVLVFLRGIIIGLLSVLCSRVQ